MWAGDTAFADEYMPAIHWVRTAVENYNSETAEPASLLWVVASMDHITAWIQRSRDCHNKYTAGLSSVSLGERDRILLYIGIQNEGAYTRAGSHIFGERLLTIH